MQGKLGEFQSAEVSENCDLYVLTNMKNVIHAYI